MLVTRPAGLLSLLLALSGGAHATILYDNLSTPIMAADPISADGPSQFNSFRTDSSGLVNTIQLLLDSQGDIGGVTVVAIYNDAGNTPGSLAANIGTVDETILSGTPTLVTFAGLNESLTPDTRYWIQVTDNTGISNQEWAFAVDATGIGVAGEFNGNTAFGVFANGDGSRGTGQPYIMCVSNNGGTVAAPDVCATPPVPEPASLGILGFGVIGIGVLLHWRRAG